MLLLNRQHSEYILRFSEKQKHPHGMIYLGVGGIHDIAFDVGLVEGDIHR